MKEQLIERKYQLEREIERIEKSIKFFDEHPEMETLLGAYMSLMARGVPGIY
jgi:hypothetical protein